MAPAIAEDLANCSGRRPVFLGMLSIYVAANIGLVVQRSYAALVVLRMLQSGGISGAFDQPWSKGSVMSRFKCSIGGVAMYLVLWVNESL